MDKHFTRRLILTIWLVLLVGGVAFYVGQQYGYRQGKTDTIRVIDKGLNEPRTARNRI